MQWLTIEVKRWMVWSIYGCYRFEVVLKENFLVFKFLES